MQQIPFIDLFKISCTCFGRQTRPSSGALFDCTAYIIKMKSLLFGTMHRYCCRPVTLSTVGSNIGALLHLVCCLHPCSNDARSHIHWALHICTCTDWLMLMSFI